MYFGYYEHSLDNKGRLMIPSKIREGMEGGTPLYLVNGFDGYLGVYDEAGYKDLCAYLEKYSDFNKDARLVKRNLYSSTVIINIDKLGRIQIPTAILEKYSISHNVAVLGAGSHFEIWDLDTYKKYQDNLEEDISSLADKLEKSNG